MRARFLFGLAALLIGCSDLAPRVGAQRDDLDAGSSAVLPSDAAPTIVFSRDIRPLIERAQNDASGKGCKACHYSTESSHIGLDLGGLDLSTLRTLRQGGGTSGARIVVAGRPSESAIVQKLRGTYPFGTRMPKSGPPFWSEEEIQKVERWIAEGAKGGDAE